VIKIDQRRSGGRKQRKLSLPWCQPRAQSVAGLKVQLTRLNRQIAEIKTLRNLQKTNGSALLKCSNRQKIKFLFRTKITLSAH
jgi:hypothetical protein